MAPSRVTIASIRKATKPRPTRLRPSLRGLGKLVLLIHFFKLHKRGLDHRGKLDGNDDLRRFAQTVERVNDHTHKWSGILFNYSRPALTRSNRAL
jgi:hypothetical protein